MSEWVLQALDKICTAVTVVDRGLKVVFWNDAMVKLSEIRKDAALGMSLQAVCPKFGEKRYHEMLESIFETGQSRFCSSAIHKAFIYPVNNIGVDTLRQNMQTDPIKLGNSIDYAIIQIDDVTEDVHNQNKYHKIIENLKKGIKEIEIEAEKRANYDTLTGILNRQGLDAELQRYIESNRTGQCSMVIFFLDMDGFKNVNDTYGHVVGDALLQQVAGRLKSHIRQSEERGKDILARMGGDEFIITIYDIPCLDDIVVIADKIVNTIRKPFFVDNKKVQISLSLGIAIYPEDGQDYQTVIMKADQAMYRVKQAGKNQYGFYNQKLQNKYRPHSI